MDREVAEFNKSISEGELPESVFKNMLRRVLQSNGTDDAHDICMNIDVLGN